MSVTHTMGKTVLRDSQQKPTKATDGTAWRAWGLVTYTVTHSQADFSSHHGLKAGMSGSKPDPLVEDIAK